ncbi:MAG: TylF/MycF/NovP-related O-methyltransferase [Bacillota bacterium]
MKKIVIAGAGQMGKAAARLMDPNGVEFLGFADNDPDKWTMQDGSMPEPVRLSKGEIPVFSIQTAVELNPDEFLISALDKERARAIEEQLKLCRFYGDVVKLHDIYADFDIRSRCLKELAERINGIPGVTEGIPGAVAELGVYRGDTAWQINELFKDRTFYMFDTFEGFAEEDVVTERAYAMSRAEAGDFSDTSFSDVYERMPYPDVCQIRKGHFPETAAGLAHVDFAFVSLDPDLYEPAFAGMEFFYPRLNEGGVMLVHDYNNTQYRGVHQAVKEYEQKLVKEGGAPLKLVPLGDLHGSCVIIK